MKIKLLTLLRDKLKGMGMLGVLILPVLSKMSDEELDGHVRNARDVLQGLITEVDNERASCASGDESGETSASSAP